MNVIKHMEAAFLFSLTVAGAASVALSPVSSAQAEVNMPVMRTAAAAPLDATLVPVVHVSARRMTAAEKQQSLAADVHGSRI